MDQPISPSQPHSRRLWTLWGLSMLVLFGLSTGLRSYIREFEIIYEQMEMKQLPLFAAFSLQWGPYLWIAVVAAALEGVRRIRTQDPVRVLSWNLVTVLAFVGLIFAMVLCIWLPMWNIQNHLRK